MKNTIFIDSTTNPNHNACSHQLQKMKFIFNAIEKGWSVKKSYDSYIFTKKHEGKREIFREKYLETFIYSNFEDNKI